MSTIGLFAGRGDVILAMGLALLVGLWLGWQAHKGFMHLRAKVSRKST